MSPPGGGKRAETPRRQRGNPLVAASRATKPMGAVPPLKLVDPYQIALKALK